MNPFAPVEGRPVEAVAKVPLAIPCRVTNCACALLARPYASWTGAASSASSLSALCSSSWSYAAPRSESARPISSTASPRASSSSCRASALVYATYGEI